MVRLHADAHGDVPAQHVGVDAHAVRGVRVLADQDDGIAAGRGHRTHAIPGLPQATPRRISVEQAELTDRGNGQRHVVQSDHAAATELVHTGAPIRVDDHVDTRAATGQRIARILIPRRGSDTHSPEGLHGLGQGLAAHAAQLPGDHAGLPVALGGRGQVRELAAADTARTRLGPGGLDAIRGRGHDFNGVRPRELLLDGAHPRADDLPGGGVTHEDDAAAVVAGHARATVGGLPDCQLEDLADPLARAPGVGTPTRGGPAAGRTLAHEFSSSVVSPGDLVGACGREADAGEAAADPTRRNGSLTR